MAQLHKRQDCAAPYSFYVCANGFRGCCSIDPCNPGATCPQANLGPLLGASATVISTSATISTIASSRTSSLATTIATSTTKGTSPSTTSSLVRSSSANIASISPSTTTSPIASGATNLTTATTTIPSTLPTESHAQTSTATQAAQTPPGTTMPNGKVIAGIVIGAVLAMLAIAAVVVLLIRRRRRNKRRSIGQSTLPRRDSMRPVEDDGKDIFAPYGGFYRGVLSVHQADSPISEKEQSEPSVSYPMQSPSLQRYRPVHADTIATTPVSSEASPTFPPRSSVPTQLDYYDFPAEMPDTSPPMSPHMPSSRWHRYSQLTNESSSLDKDLATYGLYQPASGATSSNP